MQKNTRSSQIIDLPRYRKTKRKAAAQKSLMAKVRSLTTGDKILGRDVTGWYQKRKRASQRLRNLSGGRLIFFEAGYRGDDQRHAIKSLECGHVFRSSLRELVTGEFRTGGTETFARKACPFCSDPGDLSRCGSVQAVQEIVWHLSAGKVSFADTNSLASQDAMYSFVCEIHHCVFSGTYTTFLERCKDDEEFCKYCAFERHP